MPIPSEIAFGRRTRPTSSARRPVRLAAPVVENPARAGTDLAIARVRGGRLSREGVRDGDHVFLVPGRHAARSRSFDAAALLRSGARGALASVVDRTGRGSLWRVRPDRDALALYDGGDVPAGRTGPWPDVAAVVVGVLRKFR